MLNWIVCNRIVFNIELYLGATKWFEMEMFWQKLYLD